MSDSSKIVKCPSCFKDHELVRYVRKGGKSTNGVFCDHFPVVRHSKGGTSVVEHIKFIQCFPSHEGKLREVFTPMAKKEEAAKGQGQFAMTYQSEDERKVQELNEKLDRQLKEKKRIDGLQRALDEARREIEAEAHKTSAKLSEVQTMKLI